MTLRNVMAFCYFLSGTMTYNAIDAFVFGSKTTGVLFAFVSLALFFGAETISDVFANFHLQVIKAVAKKCTCKSPIDNHSCLAHSILSEFGAIKLMNLMIKHEAEAKKALEGEVR